MLNVRAMNHFQGGASSCTTGRRLSRHRKRAASLDECCILKATDTMLDHTRSSLVVNGVARLYRCCTGARKTSCFVKRVLLCSFAPQATRQVDILGFLLLVPTQFAPSCRKAASTMMRGLAPENLKWLARYFLAQLVGWGLAPPEETDSEVVALVAPAGDRGRATLQKLHRRISTPSSGQVSRWSPDVKCVRHVTLGCICKSAAEGTPKDTGGVFIVMNGNFWSIAVVHHSN